jgi:hypothetical protein
LCFQSDEVYESDVNIRTKSKIYARNKNQRITEYQKAVNDSSFVLAKENPALLADRKELMSKAQAKVREDGNFVFKKGFSRSISATSDGKTNSSAKRKKHFQEERSIRMKEMNNSISEIEKMIVYKEQRRNKCITTKEWNTCEAISTEIRKLMSEKGELERERLLLCRKEKKAQWYQKRKTSETQDASKNSKIGKPASSTTQNKATPFTIRNYCSVGSLKQGLCSTTEVTETVLIEDEDSILAAVETSVSTSLTSVIKDHNKEVPSPIIVDASCDVANDKNVTSAQPFINCASLHVDNDASSTTSVSVEILKNSHDLSVNVGSSIECGNSSKSGESSYCADQNFLKISPFVEMTQ